MKIFLPILGDIGFGIIVTVICLSYYDTYSFYAVAYGIVWALLPDIDVLPEFFRHGKAGSHANQTKDHREILHMPIFWLIGSGILWWSSGLYGAIAFFTILVHFIHDSTSATGWGVSWLAPFSSTRIKFFVNEANKESLYPQDWIRTWNKESLRNAIIMYGDEDWIQNIYLKPTITAVTEYFIFVFSLLMFALYFFA